MLNLFRYLLLFCVMLFGVFSVTAQVAMPDNTCVGAVKHYNVDPNPFTGSTYTWRIDGITQNFSITNEIDITWYSTGTYLLDVQEVSVDGCQGPLRSGQVFVYPVPAIIAYSNSPVCEGSFINLSTELVSGGTYLWTGPNGYLSSSQNSQILSASQSDSGIYSLSVSTNGCTSEPSNITIMVNVCGDDFLFPEGFSPNGDGINDLFVIRGIENYPHNSIIIFNRWGDKVFEASPYQNTWDGRNTMGYSVGGDKLPIGTYFYLFTADDNAEVIKGTVYLNR